MQQYAMLPVISNSMSWAHRPPPLMDMYPPQPSSNFQYLRQLLENEILSFCTVSPSTKRCLRLGKDVIVPLCSCLGQKLKLVHWVRIRKHGVITCLISPSRTSARHLYASMDYHWSVFERNSWITLYFNWGGRSVDGHSSLHAWIQQHSSFRSSLHTRRTD